MAQETKDDTLCVPLPIAWSNVVRALANHRQVSYAWIMRRCLFDGLPRLFGDEAKELLAHYENLNPAELLEAKSRLQAGMVEDEFRDYTERSELV